MDRRRSINVKAYARAVVAVLLLASWSLAFLTGWLLWFAPHGPQSGRIPMLFGLTKPLWGDIHFWICLLASGVTVLHIAIDWKALKGCLRYLTTTHRSSQNPLSQT